MGNQLENLRKKVDKIDENILRLLEKRVILSKKIGEIKKENNKSFFDKKRRDEVLNQNLIKAEKLGLSKSFIKRLYSLIHQHSLNLQKDI